jgi:transposase
MEREHLERHLADGLSLERIGALAGKHPSTVAYWVNKHGLRAVNADRHAPKGGIAEGPLRELVARGLSGRAIAHELDVSLSTVRHWLKRYGLATGSARQAAIADARRRGLQTVEASCVHHGTTRFRRRRDGAYRCLRCAAESVARRRRRVKEILVAEAGGACRVCGYSAHPAALEFHHLNPAEKAFEISKGGVTRSLERAREEARKCVLLCARCHAEVEAGVVVLS